MLTLAPLLLPPQAVAVKEEGNPGTPVVKALAVASNGIPGTKENSRPGATPGPTPSPSDAE